jgi:hypothetical protein
VTTDVIRWTDAGELGRFGLAGTHEPVAFRVSPPDRSEGEERWMVLVFLGGSATHRWGETEAEAKQQAETWLREFITSLGALFAADLREHLTEQAAIHQGLGDDYGDSASPLAESQSHRYWGRAEALRDLIKYLDHELETQQ